MLPVLLYAWSDFYGLLQKQRICHLSDECGCVWEMFAFLSYLHNTYIINWIIIVMNGYQDFFQGGSQESCLQNNVQLF
jgi:hypothetical protein